MSMRLKARKKAAPTRVFMPSEAAKSQQAQAGVGAVLKLNPSVKVNVVVSHADTGANTPGWAQS